MTPTLAPTPRRGPLRHPMTWLLAALLLLMGATPLVEHLQFGDLLESVLLTLVLLAGVVAVGATRRTLLVAALLVVPALACRWISRFSADVVSHEASLVASILFIGFVAVHILRFVLRAPRVDSEVLCAAIAAYFLFALLWANAYLLGARLHPGGFAYTVGPPTGQTLNSFKALYFSLGTLTSVAYGDIIPLSSGMRVLAMAEVATGMFYMAILISRLVSLYAARRT